MTRVSCALLDNGDPFPQMEIKCVGREDLVLPRDFSGQWNIFLVYRGHW